MGKTTLAQLIFNQVNDEQFDTKIWVCVSDPFVDVRVYKAILEVTDKKSSSLSQPESLLSAIERSISGKRFLLVLDDVWTEDDPNTWIPLKESLKGGASGSKILVTTRKQTVVDVMGCTDVHPLKPLNDEECWLMLRQIAMPKKKESEPDARDGVGREIAIKCKGLPLAAHAMGNFLRTKRSVDAWEGVLKSELWELDNMREKVFPFLRFSYDELSPSHRRCFSYCAIFPKGAVINVDNLVRIWVAQGFLLLPSSSSSSSQSAMAQMEDIGFEHFQDLAMRSFFQEFDTDYNDGRLHTCKMHDIVHDFAQYLTNNKILAMEQVVGGGETIIHCKDVRHLTITSGKMTSNPAVESIEQLRSLLCRNISSPSLLAHLKSVRLLIMSDCGLQDIPEEIGNLIHIKYLDISQNKGIKQLPKTICDLYYLQTLNIERLSLCGFPEGIHKLKNLRNLFNIYAGKDFVFPQGFKKLTNLVKLEEFDTTQNKNNLAWLEKLNQLRGQLLICVDSEANEVDARKANLHKKVFIQRLILSCLKGHRLDVVDALQPPPNLKHLQFRGDFLPKWIASIKNLRHLEIASNEFIAPDAAVKLGELEFLETLIIRGQGLKRMGALDKASFPSLSKLEMCCVLWEVWEDMKSTGKEEEEEEEEDNIRMLPSLRELKLSGCRSLEALPLGILSKAPSLQILTIHECKKLSHRYQESKGSLTSSWLSHPTFILSDALWQPGWFPAGKRRSDFAMMGNRTGSKPAAKTRSGCL